MDPLEIFNDAYADENECQPALPDVDIDFLVNADFNNATTAGANRDVQFRETLDDDGLGPSHELSNEQTLLDLDAIEDFSPGHTSDDRHTQFDKKEALTYLVDCQGEDITSIVDPNDQTRMLPFPSPIFCDETTIRQGVTTPQTTNNSEHNMFTPPSVVTQGEWQSLALHAPKRMLDPIPLPTVEEVKMIPLDQGPADARQKLHELPLGDTYYKADDVKLTAPSNIGQLSSTFTSLPLPQRSSLLFQLPIAAPPAISYTENHSLKAAKTPMKHSRKRSSKARKGTPSSSHESQLGGADFGLSPDLTKKATGRRKGGANAHLSLEERKKLRAERNRESAEKSRMRRKQMVIDLETNVAALRDENGYLKAKVEKHHSRLKGVSAEINLQSKEASGKTRDEAAQIPLLYEALSALQRCMGECPRTFSRNPHSPLIPLNVARKRPRGPSNYDC